MDRGTQIKTQGPEREREREGEREKKRDKGRQQEREKEGEREEKKKRECIEKIRWKVDVWRVEIIMKVEAAR